MVHLVTIRDTERRAMLRLVQAVHSCDPIRPVRAGGMACGHAVMSDMVVGCTQVRTQPSFRCGGNRHASALTRVFDPSAEVIDQDQPFAHDRLDRQRRLDHVGQCRNDLLRPSGAEFRVESSARPEDDRVGR